MGIVRAPKMFLALQLVPIRVTIMQVCHVVTVCDTSTNASNNMLGCFWEYRYALEGCSTRLLGNCRGNVGALENYI